MLPLARDCISPGPMPGGLRIYATDSHPIPILHMLYLQASAQPQPQAKMQGAMYGLKHTPDTRCPASDSCALPIRRFLKRRTSRDKLRGMHVCEQHLHTQSPCTAPGACQDFGGQRAVLCQGY